MNELIVYLNILKLQIVNVMYIEYSKFKSKQQNGKNKQIELK